MVKEVEKVLSEEDDKFLDGVTGKEVFTEEEELDSEEEAEEEAEEVVVEKEKVVTEADIAAIQQKLGRKLTEDEIVELNEKAKVGDEEPATVEEFQLIDPNKLPKELQPHFKRMFASFTKGMQSIADVRKKAELFDYFQENPQILLDRLGIQPPRTEDTKVTARDEVAEFLGQLNLPEDHELAPAFKVLATAVAKLAKETESRDKSRDGDTLREKIGTFLDLPINKGLREDIELIRAMDRLGKESPRLYQNLERLKKFAEADIGRPAKTIQKQVKEDVYKMFREMKEAKKRGVTKPTSSTSLTVKRAKNVKEAWKQAEEQLRNK